MPKGIRNRSSVAFLIQALQVNCVTLDKLLNFSVPQFCHLKWWVITVPHHRAAVSCLEYCGGGAHSKHFINVGYDCYQPAGIYGPVWTTDE